MEETLESQDNRSTPEVQQTPFEELEAKTSLNTDTVPMRVETKIQT